MAPSALWADTASRSSVSSTNFTNSRMKMDRSSPSLKRLYQVGAQLSTIEGASCRNQDFWIRRMMKSYVSSGHVFFSARAGGLCVPPGDSSLPDTFFRVREERHAPDPQPPSARRPTLHAKPPVAPPSLAARGVGGVRRALPPYRSGAKSVGERAWGLQARL